METIVKVGRLWMGDKIYRAGDALDLTKEQIEKLGTSVEQVVSISAEVDARDAKIAELNAKIAELEKASACPSMGGVEPSASIEQGDDDVPNDEWNVAKIKQYLDDAGIEYGIRMPKIELLELANSMGVN